MTNKTIRQIKAALTTLLLRLNGTGNITTNIPADHHYKVYSAMNLASRDKDYPKLFVTLDGGKSEEAVSRSRNKALSFDIIFVFRKGTADVGVNLEVEEQCENVLEDFEALLDDDTSLGDNVDDAFITDFTTDSGFANPDGVVWIKVGVGYRKTR